MSLDNFYSLRNNFLVIGLTGRTGGGCSDICKFLQNEQNPFENLEIPNHLHINETQKFNICKNVLTDMSNKWRNFSVIKYRDILLLFFIRKIYNEVNHDFKDLSYELLLKIFQVLYCEETAKTRRLGQFEENDELVKIIHNYFLENIEVLKQSVNLFQILEKTGSMIGLNPRSAEANVKFLNKLYFADYSSFTNKFFDLIDKYDPVARQLLLQDIAFNLRSSGNVVFSEENDTQYIFTVAIAIKYLIKLNRKASGSNRIVIDSLKNSLEINFFRERYSGFYLIASSRDDAQLNKYIESKVEVMGFADREKEEVITALRRIDEAHYKILDFKKGKFTAPDIENCIQKADFYVFINQIQGPQLSTYDPIIFSYLSLELQLLKFLALIYKPGIVTPSAVERSMQLAFSSKYNSGCISRQVGAVVTDENYSVKSIGWNEVPQGQTPCSLRSLKELVNDERPAVYSDYEKNAGNYMGKSFKQKVTETLEEVYGAEEQFFNNLDGHNCPYCFKDFHNAFEGKDNQVHTRSLHAEENAMLQISKFGGQPLKGGILFTTASPCELCSKKAFQLGITKVFYIDPYPGIAIRQILKAGNDEKSNPKLFMFQGAVGRGYFKLYEPHMSIKDETAIRTDIRPKMSHDKIFQNMKNQLIEKFPNDHSIKELETYDALMDVFQKGLTNKSKE